MKPKRANILINNVTIDQFQDRNEENDRAPFRVCDHLESSRPIAFGAVVCHLTLDQGSWVRIRSGTHYSNMRVIILVSRPRLWSLPDG